MVILMVFVGGITRLTDSGLSIVEWKPVTGAIPPITGEQWQDEFSKYRRTPEYQKINYGMTLEEFKRIYLVEYFHRLLGRITGFVFLLPLVYFWLKRIIRRELLPKLVLIFLLGGLQGFIGWFMVKSGLSERTDVSQYRLVLHLGMAIIVYTYMFWVALGLLNINVQKNNNKKQQQKLFIYSTMTTFLIFIQILLGGFVAGLDAGVTYNTFPFMDGQIVPDGIFKFRPWYTNFFENIITVQFNHRIMAYVVTISIIWFFYLSRKYKIDVRVQKYSILLLIALFFQFTLGIMIIILRIPLVLASFHQVFAVVLFSVSLFITHYLYLLQKPK